MIHAPIDKVDFRISVKCFKELTEAFARNFKDLLRVFLFLLEDDIPECVSAVLGLGSVRARPANAVDELDVSQLKLMGVDLLDFINKVAHDLFLHAVDALTDNVID